VLQREVLGGELSSGGEQDRDERTDQAQHPYLRLPESLNEIGGFYTVANLLAPVRKSGRIKRDGVFGRGSLQCQWSSPNLMLC
jgi:hypothetical protein